MASLPSITSKIPPDLRQFLERVRESINAGVGGQISADELRALIRNSGAGSNNLGGGALTGPGTGILYPTPPEPTGLDAIGALASIIITWDAPSYQGHAYTEIWASDTSDFSAAVKVGMAPGAIFTHTIGDAATRYYWIRFVNANMQYTPGPFNSLVGVSATTSIDPGYIIDLVANATDLNPVTIAADAFKITSASGDLVPFSVIAIPTTINGFEVPAGVYMDGAYIKAGTITRASIGLAAIDDARIAELSADKVTFGTMHGDRIQVGTLNANRINVSYLSGIVADLGVCTAGTFKTDAGTNWRTEISSVGTWPIWYGIGTKNETNGRFTMDFSGNITIRNSAGGTMFSVVDNTLLLRGDAGDILLSSATGVPWTKIASGSGKPQDNATVGANETNWSINASATVNALVMTPQVIKFFDENGVCRGKFGRLSS